MGYYTRHSITVNNRGNIDYDMNVAHFDGDDEAFINDFLQSANLFEDDIKWYDHEKDMRKLSKRFNNVLFTLSGEGEESGDLWREYHLNGLMQRATAKIAFDDFDEAKLK